MSRERDAYRKIRENAQNSFPNTQVYDAPPAPEIKTNYISAIVWTSMVAAIVCSIFMGFLIYFVNESNLEENLQKAANHAVYNLERIVTQQNTELHNLREENKKIHDYLKLWTPIGNRLPPGVEEKWKIKGYGLPEYKFKEYSVVPLPFPETPQCLPFLE